MLVFQIASCFLKKCHLAFLSSFDFRLLTKWLNWQRCCISFSAGTHTYDHDLHHLLSTLLSHFCEFLCITLGLRSISCHGSPKLGICLTATANSALSKTSDFRKKNLLMLQSPYQWSDKELCITPPQQLSPPRNPTHTHTQTNTRVVKWWEYGVTKKGW